VQNLVQGFKLRDMKWLGKANKNNGNSNDARRLRVGRLLYWIFAFIVKLLDACFYVTETAPYKNRVFYYRKSVWATLRRLEWDRLHSTFFQRIAKSEAERLWKNRKSLGVSYLRFLPKLTGLRPILNLGRKPHPEEVRKGLSQGYSINSMLNNAFNVLNHMKTEKNLGASLFSKDEIYEKWVVLVKCWKRSPGELR
jgi:telomerase reverse transcriptase